MFFLITGEGNSDVGRESTSPGPLICALRTLAKTVTEEEFSYEIVSRTNLAKITESIPKNKKSMQLRGNRKKHAGLLVISRKAQALATAAQQKGDSGAIFFHDCDYTQSEVSDSRKYYEQLVEAVETGFYRADQYRDGVAMIPRPRSESWFLCHYQETPYRNGARFEELPANDRSSGSGKALLANHFSCPVNQIYDHICGEEIDWERIDAPSFLFFKKRFQHVVQRLTHQSPTVPESKTLLTSYE